MKKVCAILFGLFLAFCSNAFAGDINNVSSDKWLDHVAQMQVMRQQILGLLSRANPTVEDREMLRALQESFEEKKAEWDQYLIDVAEGKGNPAPAHGESFCSDCGKHICDCGKGIECKKCGKKVCDCKKACKSELESIENEKGEYHRYNKKARRHFKGEYHRYNKRHRKGCNAKTEDCCTTHGSCCDKCVENAKPVQKSACSTCPSAVKSCCASACATEVKCNEGVDCPGCPNYKSEKCCKISGKCSSGHDHGKETMKKAETKDQCPICYEYKIMGVNKKCARCAK